MRAARGRFGRGLGGTLGVLGILVALLAWPRVVGAELVAALSNHLVAVTTGFSGTSVLLFGTTDGSGDVVVVVSGPKEEATVHRKGREFGIWVNETNASFGDVPGYWAMAATRPLADIVPEAVASLHGMGLRYLGLPAVGAVPDAQAAEFRAALLRNREEAGLYVARQGEITFLGGRLFRTDLWIPSNAPIGTYTVSVYQVRDEDVVAAETAPLVVGKVGFEARVYEFAHRYPFAYGIVAVLLAAMAGWIAHLMFRRD